jgi:hypothetical protein
MVKKKIALGLVVFLIALLGIGIANKEVRCLIGLPSETCLSSTSFNVPTNGPEASEIGANYNKLANLLAKQKLQAADQETSDKIFWLAKGKPNEYLPMEKIKKIPCKDLRTINNLWLAHSKGKYGFSIQRKLYKQIYEEVRHQSQIKDVESEVYNRFARRVGWTMKDSGPSYGDELTFNPHGGEGHLPMTYITLGVPQSCRSGWFSLCFLGVHWSGIAPQISQEVLFRVGSCQL